MTTNNAAHTAAYKKIMLQMERDISKQSPSAVIKPIATGIENCTKLLHLHASQWEPVSLKWRSLPDYALRINEEKYFFDWKEANEFNQSSGNISIVWFEHIYQSFIKGYIVFDKNKRRFIKPLEHTKKKIIFPANASTTREKFDTDYNNLCNYLRINPKTYEIKEDDKVKGSGDPYVLVETTVIPVNLGNRKSYSPTSAVPYDHFINVLAVKANQWKVESIVCS